MLLGYDPPQVDVVLTAGSDFNDFMRYQVHGVPTDWPEGTTLSIVWTGFDPWTAVLDSEDGSKLVWSVDKAIANSIPHGTEQHVLYVNGTDDQVLTVGKAVRRG